MTDSLHPHARILKTLGGARTVARGIGGGTYLGNHWPARGIPPQHWPAVTRLAAATGHPEITVDALERDWKPKGVAHLAGNSCVTGGAGQATL